jgi:hypothetical protein
MNKESFLNSLKLVQTGLKNCEANRVFNSIGSNIFLQFGKNIEILLPNGKKNILKEWRIWIGNASWRITRNGKYIVGSGDNRSYIQSYLKNLLGKRFQSLRFLSQFLDAEFNFENGYQLTTFFNWKEKHQWLIFLPNQTEIVIDCSSNEFIKNIQVLANYVTIKEAYKSIELPFTEIIIKDIAYDSYNDLPFFHCENDISINLNFCTYRLEKITSIMLDILMMKMKTIFPRNYLN